MTTVAYKDGVIAADSMITTGNYKKLGVTKIGRHGTWLFGVEGDYSLYRPVMDWLVRQLDSKENPDRYFREADELLTGRAGTYDMNVLLVNPPEKTMWSGNAHGFFCEIPYGPEAVGTGACYALGAMENGATAVEAVDIAKKLDTHSGGDTASLELFA